MNSYSTTVILQKYSNKNIIRNLLFFEICRNIKQTKWKANFGSKADSDTPRLTGQ
jgi:hypothetical protein